MYGKLKLFIEFREGYHLFFLPVFKRLVNNVHAITYMPCEYGVRCL